MVTSPNQVSFAVDAKGLYRPNFWVVKAKPAKHGLFYVLALVPDKESNRFFILTQAQVNAEIEAEIGWVKQRALAGGRGTGKAASFPGLLWRFAEGCAEGWDVLPMWWRGRLQRPWRSSQRIVESTAKSVPALGGSHPVAWDLDGSSARCRDQNSSHGSAAGAAPERKPAAILAWARATGLRPGAWRPD